MPAANAAPTTVHPIYSAPTTRILSGTPNDHLEVRHSSALALSSGTISLSFSVDRLPGDVALISKDGAGRDAGGQFTVWLKDGTILIAQESASETEYLKVPDLVLDANTTYQFAMSFGADGLNVWLNGNLVASEPEFKQGIALNDKAFLVGATRAWRDSDSDPAHSLLKGSVGDVMVFDRQLGGDDMIALARAVNPALAMDAQMHADMADLAPLFEQAHHASDTLADILEDYGLNDHGHLGRPLNMILRGNADHDISGTRGDDGINAGRGDDIVKGGNGDDVIQGDYGNDKLYGGNGDDILDGGHGEDGLWGGAGNDLLISRADAREPDIANVPGRDEGDPLNELTNGKLYADQPLHGDDMLVGGTGADIFYFQTLINAKQRYIEKHTREDGSINWHGVAGENDKLHDHWVDALGNDVVMDYSRAEGDRIVIEGHTTEIGSITYGDSNGDGVMDHSVVSLYSDQGNNGGAHQYDKLGTITIYGDLVKLSDIEHTAAPAYGIVATVEDIKEAVTPTETPTNGPRLKAPSTGLPTMDDFGLRGTLAPVTGIVGAHDFSSEDRAPLILDHSAAMDLRTGTIAFSFTADRTNTFQALFSKDASGNGDGHMAAYVNEVGSLVVRIQDETTSHYLEVDHVIDDGESYDFAMAFGRKGAAVYLNGAKVAYDSDIRINLTDNDEAFVIGATGWSSTPGTTDMVNSHFNGTISDVMVFDRHLTGDQIFGKGARDDFAYFKGSIDDFAFARNANGIVIDTDGARAMIEHGTLEFARFKDMTIRLDEIQFGSARDDAIYGRDGADVLMGRAGDDDLRGHDNDDLLRGGTGEDDLFGGKGIDRLFGEEDNDRLFGGDANDMLMGGDGHDYLYGESGNDRLYGGLGDDRIYGHTWNDSGAATNDRVYFDGSFADFTFSTQTWYDSNRGTNIQQLTVTDAANGGSDGFYEGADRLIDVDWLVFEDRTVSFDSLL